MPRSPMPAPLLPALLLLALGLAACGPHAGPTEAPSDEIRRFRETHIECSPEYFRTPCQIGPDGKLYRYNPGEKGYGSKN